MTLHAWLTFLLATAVLLAVPGPTTLTVIGQSLGAGRRHAAPLVAGVALGGLAAMTLSLAGLGAVLVASAAAFALLKWIGAAYLACLGVMLWRAPVSADAAPPLGAGAASSSAGTRSRGHGVHPSVRANAVRFDQDSMWVELSDGRTLGVPLAPFPRLLHGSAEQRGHMSISSRGLRWEALDEDTSIAGLLAGRGGRPVHVGRRERPGSVERGTQVACPLGHGP